MVRDLALVFIGGGVGSVARYGVQLLMRGCGVAAGGFPWSTFAVNLAGSFLIGLFYAMSGRLALSTEMRLLLTVGLCGGFTTFSTFANDGLLLLRHGAVGMFALYALSSAVLGLACVFAGGWCGRWLAH